MKKIFYLIIILFIPLICSSQSLLNDSSISECYNLWGQRLPSKDFCKQFGIKYLPEQKDGEYYRYVDIYQVVEVRKKGNSYSGFVVNYVTSDGDLLLKKLPGGLITYSNGKIRYNKNKLSATDAQTIFDKFKSLDSIPDMKKIDGWKNQNFQYCTNGYPYYCSINSVESSQNGKFQLRNFWGYSSQSDSIQAKKSLMNFVDAIFDPSYRGGLDVRSYWKDFTKNLPPGSYVSGNVKFSIKSK